MEMTMMAPCLFGLERTLKFELGRIGAKEITAEDGRVFFKGDERILLQANLSLAVAERVFILLARCKATEFQDLFDAVSAAPLERYIRKEDAFPVKGSCLSSKLSSVPACQSVIKKAAAKRLGAYYHTPWLPETGVRCQLQFSLLRDDFLLLLDTSGDPLYKRGYRLDMGLAPIRETLASGIADLSGVRADSVVFDPMCGSGTLLIEAGLRAKGRAVGAYRPFAFENYFFLSKTLVKEERALAKEMHRPSSFFAFGSDIDPKMVEIARKNAQRAGLSDCIKFSVKPVKEFSADRAGILLCNPPYGERLLDLEAARNVCTQLGDALSHSKQLSAAVITPASDLEDSFGRKADKKRKLYNGMKPCTLYLFKAEG